MPELGDTWLHRSIAVAATTLCSVGYIRSVEWLHRRVGAAEPTSSNAYHFFWDEFIPEFPALFLPYVVK